MGMNISDITQKHSVIIGCTNSGKSTFAEHLFKNTPYKSIYYDVQEERNPPSNNVVLLQGGLSMDAIKKYNHMVIYAKFDREVRQLELAKIVKILMTLGKYYPPRKIWCNLFVDEAHEIAPLHDNKNPLNLVFTKGYRYGISGHAITQRPAALNQTILTQAENHFFFNVNLYETPYFDRFKLPFQEIEGHIRKKYHFAHWDGFKFTKYKPIKINEYGLNRKVNKDISNTE